MLRAVDRPGRCDGVELIRVREHGRLRRLRGTGVVMRRDRVDDLGEDFWLERAGPVLDETHTEVDVAEELPLPRRQEERPAVELAGAARIVEGGRGEEEVAAEPPVELGRLAAERRDADRVLEQPARVRVVAVGRRWKCTKACPEVGVSEEPPDEAAQPGVGDLVGEELEEPVQLVEVAAGLRGERCRVRALRLLERADVELQTVAEALDTSEDANRVALGETALEELDVAPDARLDPPARIDELDREVWLAAARAKPLLPCDGEDAVDHAVLGQLGDRRRARHARSLGPSPAGSFRPNAALEAVSRPSLRPRSRRAARRAGLATARRHDTRAARAPPRCKLVERGPACPPRDRCRRRARPRRVAFEGHPGSRRRPRAVDSRGDVHGARQCRAHARGLVARVRLEPYSEGGVLPHERTFEASTRARLELLRTTRAKLSPILLLHAGEGPSPPVGEPDLEATLDGTTSRLWRLDEPGVVETVTAGARRPLVIADGHHRYEAARRYHEEEGTDETSHVLAVLVSRDDSGLVVFPTHRVAAEEPVLNGGFRETEIPGGAIEGLERLAALPRDRAAFVVLRAGGAFLAEGDPTGDPVADLDATAVDRVTRGPVEFTPDAADAEAAVVRGTAAAAFLVRPPTVDQIEAVALAGETMPQKSTYFFPKLLAGLVFSPFDE